VDVNRNTNSYDGDRTCSLETTVRDNQLDGMGADGIHVVLFESASYNSEVASSIDTSNQVSVLGNTFNGCDVSADVQFMHSSVNQVGESAFNDVFIFQDNVMTDCGMMLALDDSYYGGFDDFYPAYGTPVSSSMTVDYAVQVHNNTFEGGSLADRNYVDISAHTAVPGDAIYCSAEASVKGYVDVWDNTITLTEGLGNLSASTDYAMVTNQAFYATGRDAVMDANVSATVNDNEITGDTLFSGIYVGTSAYASTTLVRSDLGDNPVVNMVSKVEVLRNNIDGAYFGISVEHIASANNALSEVHDNYEAEIANNVVSATERGIFAFVSDDTFTGSVAGGTVVDGSQSVMVASNEVNGNMDAYGIQLWLASSNGVMGRLTASADFTVADNIVMDCEEGIYAVMSPDAAQDQTLLVQNNSVTNTVDDGIFVSDGMADVLNNTVMDGTGYGIYIDNAFGSVNGNTVAGFNNSGIYSAECYDMEIMDNSVTGCADDEDWGVYINSGENLTVMGNMVEMNYRGLYVQYTWDSVISDNVVRDSTYQGVDLIGLSNCLVEDNVISDNGAYGVSINGGNGLVFGNNTVSNNAGVGVNIDVSANDQIWLYNGMYEYNDDYGIYVDANPYAPAENWYGVMWIIDGESRVTFNEVWYDGDITVMSGGALYLDSIDSFQIRGSSVDGMATLLIEEGGMLSMLNTNMVSESSDGILDPMYALGGPVSSYYEFIVFGILQAEECSILHAVSIYLGPTSDAELVGCLIADYEDNGIWVDSCSPTVSECIIIGDSMGTEGIVIEGEDAYPQIVSCFIIANRHGIYARDADLGAVYDNIFLLNLQAGIYGEAVVGKIHDNVFMLNKVEILLVDSNVTISENQIGWSKMIDALAEYAPFIELVGHHLFEMMKTSEELTGTEGELMDIGSMFDLDVSDLLLGHVGVMAMGCERLVMADNWYGMLYQAVYVMDCPDLVFGDRIAPSNLTIPYYVGLNSSTLTVPIQCVNGLYAVRTDVNLVNAYIEVLDDAVVLQGCSGSVFNSVLKGGDKALLVVPSAPTAGAEGGGFQVKSILKVHAEEDDGDSVSEAKVTVIDANGVMVARGVTDDNGDFVCTVVSYIVSAVGVDKTMNPYKVGVEFDNGNVSKDVTVADPVDGSYITSTTVTADPDWTWTFVGVTVLAIIAILIVVAMIVRKKKAT